MQTQKLRRRKSQPNSCRACNSHKDSHERMDDGGADSYGL